MMGGWLFCLTLASLPLFEISDYRVFAICLPFDTENAVSLGKFVTHFRLECTLTYESHVDSFINILKVKMSFENGHSNKFQ